VSKTSGVDGLDEPTDVGATVLADGRNLAWAAWGPSDGIPVLFFSGAAMSRRLGFGTHLVDQLGLRLVAVDRPGLGGSDPAPGRTLTSWADDVEQLIAAQRFSEPRAVAYSMGGPFALAVAAAGHVRRLALVAAQDDFAHEPTLALLPEPVAGMVRATIDDPDATEAQFAGQADADGLREMVLTTSSEPDRAIYATEPFASAYAQAVAEGFAQGAGGYARDLALAAGRWPFAVEDVEIPVDLWYGTEDASPVHSPDLGDTLARRLPRARRHVFDDAGGSILWTHAEPILTTLRDG
jgi:pimeloyl-ACP methyl ester carboxylesterase